MPSLPRPNASRQIVNGYEINGTLGSGSFGKVFRVTRKKDSVQFAMKVVSKSTLGTEKDWERFQREVDVMYSLRHNNIVQLQDFFEQDNNFHLIMDLCSDGELLHYIIKNDKLSEPIAALLFEQIVSALAYCHSHGVAHRDLKPENIFISKFPLIKVGDFGLCGFHSEGELMDTFCGSPLSAAPECLSMVNYDGAKSDRWSLGVILYAMVTGRHPWNLSNHAVMMQQILSADFTIPAHVSPGCREIISGLIQIQPDARTPLEKVLQSPWFKVASQAKVLGRLGIGRRSLPLSMTGILGQSSDVLFPKRRSVPNVIVSPFREGIGTAGGEELQGIPEESEETRASSSRMFAPTGVDLEAIAAGRRSSVGSGPIGTKERSLLARTAETQLLGIRGGEIGKGT